MIFPFTTVYKKTIPDRFAFIQHANTALKRALGPNAITGVRLEAPFKKFLATYINKNGLGAAFIQNSHVLHGNTGYTPGTSDIIVCTRDGRFVSLEVKKSLREDLSSEQKNMRRALEAVTGKVVYHKITPENFASVLEAVL